MKPTQPLSATICSTTSNAANIKSAESFCITSINSTTLSKKKPNKNIDYFFRSIYQFEGGLIESKKG